MDELTEAIKAHTEALIQFDYKLNRVLDALESNSQAQNNVAEAVIRAEKNSREYG
ncbi:hypothetical protein SEA_WEASELS2_262 [Rhodococcus phage Weasels2]|uniref:Uncharacterized protein n=1 Tax=Rhodococcus phage Weasels2 TaxID=1897437 RepID=A0A1I9SAN4_9CAUD|nr:hypothetical protein FDH04_gp154 [Rhodococcus phage Weasels2]AOZ63840.1 hypothetical protein SEA_WEASELS2_262 [Rhodococcus phage Weasels2]